MQGPTGLNDISNPTKTSWPHMVSQRTLVSQVLLILRCQIRSLMRCRSGVSDPVVTPRKLPR